MTLSDILWLTLLSSIGSRIFPQPGIFHRFSLFTGRQFYRDERGRGGGRWPEVALRAPGLHVNEPKNNRCAQRGQNLLVYIQNSPLTQFLVTLAVDTACGRPWAWNRNRKRGPCFCCHWNCRVDLPPSPPLANIVKIGAFLPSLLVFIFSVVNAEVFPLLSCSPWTLVHYMYTYWQTRISAFIAKL